MGKVVPNEQGHKRGGGAAAKSARRMVRGLGSGRKEAGKFLVIFLGIVACYYALTALPWVDREIIYPVLRLTATSASATLNLIGDQTRCEGVLIRGPGYGIAVRRGCDPLDPVILLVAGIVAFPASWRQRIVGIGIGSVIMFCLNLIRIDSLYVLRGQRVSWWEPFHQEWWPALFILVCLLFWVFWLSWIKRPPRPDHV